MGLDMYLTRKKYIGSNYDFRKVEANISIKINGKEIPIDVNKIGYIEEAIAYWRKANAIHNWFVNNVQDGQDDCKEYYVSVKDLEKLLDLCKMVKEKAVLKKGKIENGRTLKDGKWEPILEDGEYIKNKDEIETLLPTADGFFFGSTAYDEYYMQDINYTIKTLTKILEEEKKLNELGFYSDFCYRASW